MVIRCLLNKKVISLKQETAGNCCSFLWERFRKRKGLKSGWKRVGSLILASAMLITMIPVETRAEGIGAGTTDRGCIASFSFDDAETGFVDSVTGAKAEYAADETEFGNAGTKEGVITSDEKVKGAGALSLSSDKKEYLTISDRSGGSLLTGYDEITVSYWSKVDFDSDKVEKTDWGTANNWGFMASNKEDTWGKRINARDIGKIVGIERTGNAAEGKGYIEGPNTNNEWKLVTVVFAEGKTELYINQTCVSTAEDTFTKLSEVLGDESVFEIGKAYGGQYFTGYIDEFQVYNYALTSEEIKQLITHDHTLSKVEAKAATCTEAGNQEYWKCSVCGKLFSDAGTTETTLEEVTIKKTGHKWNQGEVTKPATETEDGIKTYTCTVCNTTKTESIRKTGREDESIVYFVDCGDHIVDTVCEGDQFGTHNSVTDQVYGKDAATGYEWGVVDTMSEPLANGSDECGGAFTDWTWPLEQVYPNADAPDSTETVRYTRNQNEAGINPRYIDYAFEIEKGNYLVEIYCANTWNNANSPVLLLNSENPAEDFQNGMGTKVVPKTVTKQNVEMKEKGTLKVSLRASGEENLAIQLAYIRIIDLNKENPEEIIAKDMAEVIFQNKEILENLSLPEKGKYGSTITWKSLMPKLCSDKGVVTRPAAGEADAPLTLKAVFSYDNGVKSARKEQEYTFTVMAESELDNLQAFLLDEVKVTDGYYLSAQTSDIAFLNQFDADRLLSRFRETAGLDTKGKKPYQGWEDSLIGGHCVGHYMTAAAQAVKATGDEQLKAKLDYMIDELKKCQDALGTGFIFGAEVRDPNNVERQFDVVEGKIDGGKNEPNADDKNMNDTWVPWYTMHKIVQGLIDVHRYTDNDDALRIAEDLGDWIYDRVSKWSQDSQNRILWSEYGGMNDCMYELYKYTKNPNHMEAAHKFDDPQLYKEILSGQEDTLKGRHANTTIPKFLGALNRYVALKESGGEMSEEDEAYLGYAEGFWDLVVNKHTFITGGTSVMEHFRADNGLDAIRTQTNCESCCAHNMLRISRELFRLTGKKKYADYYESTLRNAILGSIDTTKGSTMYFVPMATGYYKVFGEGSPADNMFWCCTGTGMENFTKLGDSIYFHNDKSLVVNQYVASELTWKDKKVKLTQDADLTKSEKARFTVNLLDNALSAEMNLYLRIPDWIAGDAVVAVNGTAQEVKISNGYTAVRRTWKNGDVVEITLPMAVKAFGLSDNGSVYGFKYGPTVLAARLGTDKMEERIWAGANLTAPGYKVVGSEDAYIAIGYGDVTRQILGTETLVIQDEDVTVEQFMADIDKYFVKDENGLSFHIQGTDAELTFEDGLEFVPFNTLNEERYGIYWYFESQAGGNLEEKLLAEKEEGRFTKSILDSTQPGYQQYENDSTHQMQENGSVAGTIPVGSSTRYAQAGGFFSYTMQVNLQKKNSVLCQFAKEDNGKTIKITVGNTVIAQKTLDYDGAEEFYKCYFEIPEDVLQAAKETLDLGDRKTADAVRVKFESNDSNDSARLVGGLWTTSNYNNDASIRELVSSVGDVKEIENGYTITVPKGTDTLNLRVGIADEMGLLYIDGVLVNDAKANVITFDETGKILALKVYAEDHETFKDYTVKIQFAGEEEPPVEEKISISKARISAIPAQTYTGKALKPSVTVTYNGGKLVKNTDYTVSYKNNTKIGKATVTITGKGKYTGKVTKNFTITVKKNKVYIVGDFKYKITNAKTNGKGTVTLSGVKSSAVRKKLKKINVASTVNIGGKKFNVTAIGNNACKGCTKATSIVVGKNVKTIGSSAFSGCTKVISATVGANVTKIDTNAFYTCKKLKKIVIKSTKLKSVGKNVIKGISKKAVITCPKKQKAKYKKFFKASTGYKKTMKIK